MDFEKERGFQKKIDDLERKNIDKRRIRTINKSKKLSTIESVFDERTIFHLSKLIQNGPLDRIEGIISAGKEANVYLGYDTDENEVALKIYKIDRNTSKWMRNYIIGDPRFKKIPNNISKIIYLWGRKEFKNLKRCYKNNLPVPKPIEIRKNILLMEYIGFGPIPAPKLKDIRHIRNPNLLFNLILSFMKDLFQEAKLVHGDLSEFNILYHNQKPIIIDISQAVSIEHPKSEKYLVRDIKNIFNYFDHLGIKVPNPEEFYYDVIDI